MARTTPMQLCREYQVSEMEMWKLMRELRFNVTRMAARLTDSQERRLRTYWENQAKLKSRPSAKEAAAPRPCKPGVSPVAAAQGVEMESFPKTCTCCQRRWLLNAAESRPEPLCPECRDHYAFDGEGIERRLARAESHAQLYQHDRDLAYGQVSRMAAERDRAYAARSKWRNALVDVVLDHDEGPDGLCWCGHKYPCRTWQTLQQANRGIHRQVEVWASWSDERLEEFLYGEASRRTETYELDVDDLIREDEAKPEADGVA
jgi:hypothetical protein